jgi:hypothetical protein
MLIKILEKRKNQAEKKKKETSTIALLYAYA